MSKTHLLTATLLLATIASPSAAAKKWMEVKSPHFTMISSDSERVTRNVVWEFEQIRAVSERMWPWMRVDLPKPLLILGASNEKVMKTLAPVHWERGNLHPVGVFAEGPDRYYVVLRTDVKAPDQEGVNRYRSVFWSYLGVLIRASEDRPLPLWLERGLQSLYSNVLVVDHDVQLGRVVPADVRRLREHKRLPVKELLTIDANSVWVTDSARVSTFHAQCALFLHMLMYGDQTSQRARLVDAYATRVRGGEASALAFEAVFGDAAAMDKAFANYILQPVQVSGRSFRIDMRVQRDRLEARALSDADAALAAAAYHVATARNQEAVTEIASARATGTAAATAFDIEGMMFDTARDTEKARAAYGQAVAEHSTSYYSYFRLAVLTMEQRAQPETLARVASLLEQSVALNDRFAPSQFRLSQVKARLGQWDEALRYAERAVALDPGAVQPRLNLAMRLWGSGKKDAAQIQLQQAQTRARNPSETESVTAVEAQMAGRGGVLGGILAGMAAAPPPPSSPPPPGASVRVGGNISPPPKVRDVKPVYPSIAQAAGVAGVVIVEAVIGPDGRVQTARILRSIPLLDQAALDAVRQWEYGVTRLNGIPVPVIMTVTVNFTLP